MPPMPKTRIGHAQPCSLCYNAYSVQTRQVHGSSPTAIAMLLTITNTTPPATDLGFLLVKNPARVQAFPLAFGTAHVFYPEATAERCTAALLLDIDPVALVRGRQGAQAEGGLLDHYVNDRSYVASSFMSVALAQVLGAALGGKSKDRPDLVHTPLTLEAQLAALPAHGGEALIRRLFEPLGYTLNIQPHLRNEQFPEWGQSPYYTVTLKGVCRLTDLLAHLYVLVPVLDDEKHYFFGQDEIEKLLRRGEGWLQTHPERELITARYLRRKPLIREALARLVETDPDALEQAHAQEEAVVEERVSLYTQRLGAVLATLKQSSAARVLDLDAAKGGCFSCCCKTKLSPRSSAWMCRIECWSGPGKSYAWTVYRPSNRRASRCCTAR